MEYGPEACVQSLPEVARSLRACQRMGCVSLDFEVTGQKLVCPTYVYQQIERAS